MKATELLEKQHRIVEDLFERFELADGPEERAKTFELIASILVAHDAIEREIFYPACERELGKEDEILRESLVEHGLVEFALFRADMHRTKSILEQYVNTLKEIVEQHVEEEEVELFPRVERRLPVPRLEALGTKMQARFDAAMRDDFRATLRANLEEVIAGATTTAKPPARIVRSVARSTRKARPAKKTRAGTASRARTSR